MTDAEMARALSGATQECPDCKGGNAMVTSGVPGDGMYPCETCAPPHGDGIGRVPILNPERARKACPNCGGWGRFYSTVIASIWIGCGLCHGDGWLSTLLEEPETCPAPLCRNGHIVEPDGADMGGCGACRGTGIVQAWRLQLLIGLLEEAGYELIYDTVSGGYPLGLVIGARWQIYTRGGDVPLTQHASLAVAACEALGVGTEVKG